MKHVYGLGLIVAGMLTFSLKAQIPSAPSAPAAPAVPSAPAAPGGVPSAAQQPQNIWDKCMPREDQIQKCKDKFCKHSLGKMISSMMQPFTLYSGGLVNECCPEEKPNPEDLAKGAGSPEGAVAAIKADEAGAKARRADMRYLGTVDCHYWPEAESALIKGLRTDKNECVRWEAALSLGRGCCCTKKTMEAMRITVTGSEKDGNPAELSERVKTAALHGLNRCAACFKDKAAAEPKEKPVPTASKPPDPMLPPYYVELDKVPLERLVADARRALAELKPPATTAPMLTGRQSVTDIVNSAAGTAPPKAVTVATAPETGPIRPVAAGSTAAPRATAVPPQERAPRDLMQYFKTNWGSRPTAEPPRAPAPQAATLPTGPAERASVPPTGNRDLFHLLKNSIGGN